jgi:hypothetical protein
MDEERLSKVMRAALVDHFYGWELVELLDIDIEDVVDAFEEEILENLPFIIEEMDYEDELDRDFDPRD